MDSKTREKIDAAFKSIIDKCKEKNIEPVSAGLIEMQKVSGECLQDIRERMYERMRDGNIKSYHSINGVRFFEYG